MIAKRQTRDEVMAKLQKKVADKKPLFFASCGSGLVAKLLERAGADSVTPFGGGKLRSDGGDPCISTGLCWTPMVNYLN